VLFGFLSALIVGAGVVSAAPEPCPPNTPWESLCNVEPELRRSYLLIEQVGDLDTSRDALSGMVRDRKVRVEWDWQDVNVTHLGAFMPWTRQVLVPAHIRGQPDRVEAAILAHELMHAFANHLGLFRPFTQQSCLEDEKLAFMIGQIYYDRVSQFSGRPDRPATNLDATFSLQQLDWALRGGKRAGLEQMAHEHLIRNGYLAHCTR
jgi:hypothetical protein